MQQGPRTLGWRWHARESKLGSASGTRPARDHRHRPRRRSKPPPPPPPPPPPSPPPPPPPPPPQPPLLYRYHYHRVLLISTSFIYDYARIKPPFVSVSTRSLTLLYFSLLSLCSFVSFPIFKRYKSLLCSSFLSQKA